MRSNQIHPALVRATDNLKKRLLQYEVAEMQVIRQRTRKGSKIVHRRRNLLHAIANWLEALSTEPDQEQLDAD